MSLIKKNVGKAYKNVVGSEKIYFNYIFSRSQWDHIYSDKFEP